MLIREGDAGDAYYVIADGALHIAREGRSLGLRHRGDGVGEIALLTGTPRTATVTAEGAATVYELGRQPFLAAVSGHPGTTGLHPAAATILDERLRDDDPAAGTDPRRRRVREGAPRSRDGLRSARDVTARPGSRRSSRPATPSGGSVRGACAPYRRAAAPTPSARSRS